MKKLFLFSLTSLLLLVSCKNQNETDKTLKLPKESLQKNTSVVFPSKINIEGIAQNPEGIAYNKKDQTFLLSSLNAGPIIKINLDGTYKPFTSGEPYPMSTAGLQIDAKRNRLLATAFNGLELFDNDPNTKGISNLRIYNLETGKMEKDINLSSLVPNAPAYMANDVTVDDKGNIYVTDWYAGVVYKIDTEGNNTVLWKNETGLKSGANGIDFHPDGYLLVSLVSVNKQGLYDQYGLVKIPLENPKNAKLVKIESGYTGFDGMVITEKGNVIGVTNNAKTPGGNTLIELTSNDHWETAEALHSKNIKPSTTVAVTPKGMNYIINQDFSPQAASSQNWTIEKIDF